MSATEPTNKGGRPPVGPVVNVRLRPDILKRVDVIAADLGMTRAETIRRLVSAGIASGLLGDGENAPARHLRSL